MQHNTFVKKSYRLQGQKSYSYCLKSVFALHSETINIWTHLMAFSWYGWMIVDLNRNGPKNFDEVDMLLMSGAYASCMVTWIISSLYHCLLCHSEPVYLLWLKLDIMGIAFGFTVTANVFIYYAFYFDQTLKTLYIALITSSGLQVGMWTMSFGKSTPDSCTFNLVILALLWCVPAAHFMYAQEMSRRIGDILDSFLKMILANGLGGFVYFSKIPERYLTKRNQLEFFFLPNSHQIMHVLSPIGGWYAINMILLTADFQYSK